MPANAWLQRSRTAGVYAALILWAGVCLFPIYWVAATSLKRPLDLVGRPVYLPFLDFSPSLEAWRYILFDSNDDPLLRFANSLVVGLASTALTIGLALLAVYGATRGIRDRRGDGLLLAILTTRILPPIIIVLPIYLMIQRLGLLDTRMALVLTYCAVNLPVAVWLVRAMLGSRASDIEEAAALDGASKWRVLRDIVIPLAAPGIAAAASILFLLSWNEYLFSVYLAPDHAMTMPPFLAAQMSVREQQAGAEAEEWARLAAAVLLMIAPLVIAAAGAQRLIGQVLRRPN